MTRIKFIAALTALTIVVGAVPALADEAGEDEGEASAQLDHDSPLALLLAVEFGIAVESVADLRDMGLGFGDIFKLTTLSTVLGVEVDALLASALVNPETGEYEFAWGGSRRHSRRSSRCWPASRKLRSHRVRGEPPSRPRRAPA